MQSPKTQMFYKSLKDCVSGEGRLGWVHVYDSCVGMDRGTCSLHMEAHKKNPICD